MTDEEEGDVGPSIYMRSATQDGVVEIQVGGSKDDSLSQIRQAARDSFEQAVERNPDLNEEKEIRGTQ